MPKISNSQNLVAARAADTVDNLDDLTQAVKDHFLDGKTDLEGRQELRALATNFFLKKPDSKKQVSSYQTWLEHANSPSRLGHRTQQEFLRRVARADSCAADYDSEDDEEQGNDLLTTLATCSHAGLQAAEEGASDATGDKRCSALKKAYQASARLRGDWDAATEVLRLRYAAALLDKQQFSRAQEVVRYHIQGGGLCVWEQAAPDVTKIANHGLCMFPMGATEKERKVFDNCLVVLAPHAVGEERQRIDVRLGKMPDDTATPAPTRSSGAVASSAAHVTYAQKMQNLVDSICVEKDGRFWKDYRQAGQRHIDHLNHGCKDDVEHQKRWLNDFVKYIASGRAPKKEKDVDQVETDLARAFNNIVGHKNAKDRLTDLMLTLHLREGCKRFFLEGPKGNGKSELIRMCAGAAGIPCRNDLGPGLRPDSLLGTPSGTVDGNASPLAELMMSEGTRRIIYWVDEIDKIKDKVENLLAPLMGSNEPFVDRYFGFPIDLSRVILMGTLNDSQACASHIQSRMEGKTIKTDNMTRYDVEKIAEIKFRQLKESLETIYGDGSSVTINPECIGNIVVRVEDAFHQLGKAAISRDCRPLGDYIDTLLDWLARRQVKEVTVDHLQVALQDAVSLEIQRGDTFGEWTIHCSADDVWRKMENGALTWHLNFEGAKAKLHMGHEGLTLTWLDDAPTSASAQIVSISHLDVNAPIPVRAKSQHDWELPQRPIHPNSDPFRWFWDDKGEVREAIGTHHKTNQNASLKIELRMRRELTGYEQSSVGLLDMLKNKTDGAAEKNLAMAKAWVERKAFLRQEVWHGRMRDKDVAKERARFNEDGVIDCLDAWHNLIRTFIVPPANQPLAKKVNLLKNVWEDMANLVRRESPQEIFEFPFKLYVSLASHGVTEKVYYITPMPVLTSWERKENYNNYFSIGRVFRQALRGPDEAMARDTWLGCDILFRFLGYSIKSVTPQSFFSRTLTVKIDRFPQAR